MMFFLVEEIEVKLVNTTYKPLLSVDYVILIEGSEVNIIMRLSTRISLEMLPYIYRHSFEAN